MARPLVRVSVAFMAWGAVGLAISIPAGWPAEFDTDTATVGDWWLVGTLLGPPLTILLAQGGLTALLLSARRALVGLGAAGLLVLSVVYLIATLGEPWRPERSDAPLAVVALHRIPSLALIAALLALSVWTLARLVRARRSAPA